MADFDDEGVISGETGLLDDEEEDEDDLASHGFREVGADGEAVEKPETEVEEEEEPEF